MNTQQSMYKLLYDSHYTPALWEYIVLCLSSRVAVTLFLDT